MEKKLLHEKVWMWIVFAIFVLYSLTLIFPFVWCFYNSFKANDEFFLDVWSLPKEWLFSNWVDSFTLSVNGVNILGMYGNSIFMTVACTGISIMMSAMTSYIIAKYRFRGSMFFYSAAFVLMMIPSMGSMSAMYKMYNDLGLYDTYLGIIIGSFGGLGTGFVLLYGFFKNLDWSYAEAASVDGAGHYTIFFRIMFPMALPGIVAVAILSAIGVWNDYFTVYMYAPSKTTIAVGLQGLVDQMKYRANYPLLFAVMLISLIPILTVFGIFQKTIMENTTVGGLKG